MYFHFFIGFGCVVNFSKVWMQTNTVQMTIKLDQFSITTKAKISLDSIKKETILKGSPHFSNLAPNDRNLFNGFHNETRRIEIHVRDTPPIKRVCKTDSEKGDSSDFTLPKQVAGQKNEYVFEILFSVWSHASNV